MATSVPDNASLEQDLVVAQAAVTKQGDTVRSLKASLKEGKADKERTSSPCCPKTGGPPDGAPEHCKPCRPKLRLRSRS